MDPNVPPVGAVPVLPYFTPENLRELEAARRAARKVRRAVSVANFDGWTIAIFGALTLAMGLTDWTNILLGLGLGVVAYFELRNAARLKRLEPDSARMLGFNQLGLATVLILYACWELYVSSRAGGTAAALGVTDPNVSQMLGPIEDLTTMITHAVYGALILIAVFAQGSMALYYFTRARIIRDYVASTPEWIITLQKAGVAL